MRLATTGDVHPAGAPQRRRKVVGLAMCASPAHTRPIRMRSACSAPRGKYSALALASSCKSCGYGRVSQGASSCTACPAGNFRYQMRRARLPAVILFSCWFRKVRTVPPGRRWDCNVHAPASARSEDRILDSSRHA